jgi:UDP-2,3-diacylglucosamine pyrophosphatase LpxH
MLADTFPGTAMLDAVILSDLHLGCDNCQAKRVVRFLEQICHGEVKTRHLILNGDVFDSIDFRRLNKNHWKVLSLIRKLSDHLEIIWLCGNHDGSAEIISHLLGVTVQDDYTLLSGGEKILILHGHIFDAFIDKHRILTWLGDCVYAFLQWIDRTHTLAKVAKRGSKTFLRCARKIEEGAVELAKKRGCAAVCCGHTHAAMVNEEREVPYYNSGCWTELPGTYLTVLDGVVELHTFDMQREPAEEKAAATTEVEVAVS